MYIYIFAVSIFFSSNTNHEIGIGGHYSLGKKLWRKKSIFILYLVCFDIPKKIVRLINGLNSLKQVKHFDVHRSI